MTNLLIPFECPIYGSDGFKQVEVKGRDGSSRLTQAYLRGVIPEQKREIFAR